MTTQKKEDRRVKYTKKTIKESFLDLFETKPLEKISVTEICNAADINRGTFYSHYSDPYDLKKKLEQEFIETVKEKMLTCDKAANNEIPTVCTFRVLKENRELSRVFTGPNGDFTQLIHVVGSQGTNQIGEIYKSLNEKYPQNAECLQFIMYSSITAVIKYWFDNGMKESPEEIADILDRFMINGLSAFIPIGTTP